MPKKSSKNVHHRPAPVSQLVVKEDGQEYAQVLAPLGNKRFKVVCFDGQTRLAHLRGIIRKNQWVSTGDIVLVCLRDFQDDKVDIMVKYTPEQVRQLKSMGEIPTNVKESHTLEEEEGAEEDEFVFEDI